MKMKIVFMGSPSFALPSLETLFREKFDILCVYTQPPQPSGRGKKLKKTPVHETAIGLGLKVRHPSTLKTNDIKNEFIDLKADVAVVVAYGLLLPLSFLNAPRLGCINVHASILPRWRGAAPINRAIMAGDKSSGVSIMKMHQGLDTGPILSKKRVSIKENDTADTLHNKLSKEGAILLKKTLLNFNEHLPHPQVKSGVIYAPKIDKKEAQIDWSSNAVTLDRLIRGLSPFPGAWTMFQGVRLKFLDSEVIQMESPLTVPGEVLNDRLHVACGKGVLRIKRVHREGKIAQEATEFLRGTNIKKGSRLG